MSPTPTAGTVVAVSADTVTVATKTGPVTINRRIDSTAYRQGDRVRVVNGHVTGRITSSPLTVRV